MACKSIGFDHISSEIRARINEGPVAIIECVEEIPCNPCVISCSFNAISFSESLVSTPKLDIKKCTGCGICITKCPGMAIFVIDGSYSDTEGLVSIPYELLPLPKENQIVKITGKDGNILCKGEVFKVKTSKSFDCTTVVTLKVLKKHLMDARGFKFI